MKRNSFLKALLAAGSTLLAPLAAVSRFRPWGRAEKGIRVEAGKDRNGNPLSLLEGDTFYTKVATADTDGDMYVFESSREKKGGPPLHYHYAQDEWWYILEGEFLFQVGDQTFTAKKGDSVFGPRNVPHAFAKTNEGPARMLIAFQPAGRMEAHFKAVSEGVYGKLSEEEKRRFRQANGFEVVGPALIHDKTGTTDKKN